MKHLIADSRERGTQNQNQPPRTAGRCMDSVEPPEMHTDGVSEQPHPDIRQETTTAVTERETVAFPPKDYVRQPQTQPICGGETQEIEAIKMDPLATPLPSSKPIPAVAVPVHSVHPTKTPAKRLTNNDRHKEGRESREGPENHQDTVRNLMKTTADDRPGFNNVNPRPIFLPLPMNPNWSHPGASCAPIARQAEPVQRPSGVYLSPFDDSTESKVQDAAETVIRVIQATTKSETRHTAHQREAYIMNKPTRLIPDRGKRLHTKPNTTRPEPSRRQNPYIYFVQCNFHVWAP